MECHHPRRLARSRRETQKASDGVHDFCDGSPSRMRRVRRISLGMTTRPKSSQRVKGKAKIKNYFEKNQNFIILTIFRAKKYNEIQGACVIILAKRVFH